MLRQISMCVLLSGVLCVGLAGYSQVDAACNLGSYACWDGVTPAACSGVAPPPGGCGLIPTCTCYFGGGTCGCFLPPPGFFCECL
jgi:hypothetical protein